MSTADVKRASQEMAQTLRAAMQNSLQKAGYQVVASPGAGVLVLALIGYGITIDRNCSDLSDVVGGSFRFRLCRLAAEPIGAPAASSRSCTSRGSTEPRLV